MRLSNRDRILDAAIEVTNREGITAVTLDTVAAQAGVTRGGLMYHFNSRGALLQAINQHLAERWEANLIEYAGKPFEETTETERHQAYVRGAVNNATRAELLFLLEFASEPALAAPWAAIVERWAAPQPRSADDPAALVRFIARLAADGLWAHGFVSSQSMSKDARQQVAESLASLVGSDSTQAAFLKTLQ